CKINEKPTPKAGRLHPVPQEKEYVDIDKSIGRISGGSIIPYPPGIPFICPGEELSTEAVEYIKALRAAGEKVIG
ncbi:MAG: hypothetical protein RR661_03440, partial [Anaerovoracaceae bacterium]